MADLSFSFVATVLPEAGCDLKEWPGETLSVGHAISATLAAPSIDQAKSRIAEVWPGSTRDGVDVNGLPGPLRRRRLLIADMESTIIEQEMLDELADFVGKRPEVEAITEAAMRGELDFEQAINERVALLAGLYATKLDDLIATRMTYSPGARALVQTMKANGATCALVSGGFTHFTQRVADELGFDEHRANTLEIEDGRLTGRVVPPILGRAAKLTALDEITSRLGIARDDAIAVGDGSNDLAMLEAAGLGVAYRAKPAVRDAMAAHPTGAVVNYCDLTALLYLQGYTEADVRAGS